MAKMNPLADLSLDELSAKMNEAKTNEKAAKSDYDKLRKEWIARLDEEVGENQPILFLNEQDGLVYERQVRRSKSFDMDTFRQEYPDLADLVTKQTVTYELDDDLLEKAVKVDPGIVPVIKSCIREGDPTTYVLIRKPTDDDKKELGLDGANDGDD